MTLSLPLINDLPDWFPDPFWTDRYKGWLSEARLRATESENDRGTTNAIRHGDRNHYNLDIFLALARFMEHHWRLFLDLARAEEQIKQGQGLALESHADQAISVLAGAYDTIDQLRKDGLKSYDDLRTVFEKSRYPKARPVGGREFVHVFDDVKDHFADRRADLSYMRAPEDSLGLDRWLNELAAAIKLYAKENHAAVPPTLR